MDTLTPLWTPASDLDGALHDRGHAVLDARGVADLLGLTGTHDLDALAPLWDDLPSDTYLRDGGSYRYRRHGCFEVQGDQVTDVPHRAHWQPLEYNALHGGIERMFEPLDPRMSQAPVWRRLLAVLGGRADALRDRVAADAAHPRRWAVEAHPFRIDTAGGIGRPTPEGAHRDGVDLVAVMLVGRVGVKGGETRVFEANGPHGLRFTMNTPWTLLLLDDTRVIHETTPIQPVDPDGAGHRDTLVITYRADGFQSA